MTSQTVRGPSDTPCDCCGRVHRKLFPFAGLLLGKTCLEQVKLYTNNKDRAALCWRTYEEQYDKVKAMFDRITIVDGRAVKETTKYREHGSRSIKTEKEKAE